MSKSPKSARHIEMNEPICDEKLTMLEPSCTKKSVEKANIEMPNTCASARTRRQHARRGSATDTARQLSSVRSLRGTCPLAMGSDGVIMHRAASARQLSVTRSSDGDGARGEHVVSLSSVAHHRKEDHICERLLQHERCEAHLRHKCGEELGNLEQLHAHAER